MYLHFSGNLLFQLAAHFFPIKLFIFFHTFVEHLVLEYESSPCYVCVANVFFSVHYLPCSLLVISLFPRKDFELYVVESVRFFLL